MLRLIGVVISIGLADSLNPSTIAPALYLASGRSAMTDLTQFTGAVFGTYFLGGALIVLGPGEGILALVPHPSATTRYVLELVAGAAMLLAAGYLWRRRGRLSRRELPGPPKGGRSSAWLGVTIMLVELPTAFPYFAAIAAIVGSGLGLGHQVVALVIYNGCFVLPLLLIMGTVAVAGDRAEQILTGAREFIQLRWPVLLAVVGLVAGLFVVTLGATGLAGAGHGRVARFSRGLRRVIAH